MRWHKDTAFRWTSADGAYVIHKVPDKWGAWTYMPGYYAPSAIHDGQRSYGSTALAVCRTLAEAKAAASDHAKAAA